MPDPNINKYVRCCAEGGEFRAIVLGPSFERDARNELVLDGEGQPVRIPDAIDLQLMVKVGIEMRIAGGKTGALRATTAEHKSTPGYWWPE